MDRDYVRGQIRRLIDEKCGNNKSCFAKSIGKSAGNVNDWLDKKSFPKEDALEKIREVYGVTREWIRGEEPQPKSKPIPPVIQEVPHETMHNRENLLIQLGRAQGEAKAYKDALKDSTLYYFQKIDNSFNVLIDLVKEKKTEQSDPASSEPTPGEASGESNGIQEQKIVIVKPNKLPRGERR
jgi:hypothetical protein